MTQSCLVFDIDDTLYLERDYVRSGFYAAERALAKSVSPAGFAELCWHLFEAGVRREIFDRALVELDVEPTDSLVQHLVHAYRTHRPSIELLPDAISALTWANGASRVAVISDGALASQTAKVETLGIRRWCRTVILTDEWGPGFMKPHVRAFEHVMATMSVTGPECAYIADNPTKDFVAPSELGWMTIRVRRPLSLHQNLDSGEDVNLEVAHLDEAVRALRGVL